MSQTPDAFVYPLDQQPAESMVIHCADPRFQVPIRRFVTESLGVKNYLPIIRGGGVHALGAKGYAPREFETLWHQVTFMLDLFKLPEVIIFGHEDCRWYQNHAEHYHGVAPGTKCRTDLPMVAAMLHEAYPAMTIRLFWAGIDGENVRFENVKFG